MAVAAFQFSNRLRARYSGASRNRVCVRGERLHFSTIRRCCSTKDSEIVLSDCCKLHAVFWVGSDHGYCPVLYSKRIYYPTPSLDDTELPFRQVFTVTRTVRLFPVGRLGLQQAKEFSGLPLRSQLFYRAFFWNGLPSLSTVRRERLRLRRDC